MGTAKVFRFKRADITHGIEIESNRWATLDAIEHIRGVPIEESVMEVDESLLDGDEFLVRATFEWQQPPSPLDKERVEREILELLEKPRMERTPCHDGPFWVAIVFTGPYEEAAKAKIQCRCGRPLAMLERELRDGQVTWSWQGVGDQP